MKIQKGDKVIIKKKRYLSLEYPKWIRTAVKEKIELEVVTHISMKGYLVRNCDGHTHIFNTSDLRMIGGTKDEC